LKLMSETAVPKPPTSVAIPVSWLILMSELGLLGEPLATAPYSTPVRGSAARPVNETGAPATRIGPTAVEAPVAWLMTYRMPFTPFEPVAPKSTSWAEAEAAQSEVAIAMTAASRLRQDI